MKKILTDDQTVELGKNLRKLNKRLVVVGGCFDLLHPGHLAFLKAAKQKGDILIVLLESDQAIKKLKGEGRPVQDQQKRATMLSQFPYPDYIVLLDGIPSDTIYDELILAIKPAIIATTEGDPGEHHKKRQAELSGASLMKVIKRLPDYSTSMSVKKAQNV